MADAITGVAETPLQYLLRRIPRDAIYQWTTPEADRAVWQLASNSAPIGRLAHEAADRLDAAASPPAREEVSAEGAGELLPCPFCGGKAHVDQEHGRTRVFCSSPDCPATSLSIDSYGNEEAKTAWNTRQRSAGNGAALLAEYEAAKTAVDYAKPEWASYPAMIERRTKATKALLSALRARTTEPTDQRDYTQPAPSESDDRLRVDGLVEIISDWFDRIPGFENTGSGTIRGRYPTGFNDVEFDHIALATDILAALNEEG